MRSSGFKILYKFRSGVTPFPKQTFYRLGRSIVCYELRLLIMPMCEEEELSTSNPQLAVFHLLCGMRLRLGHTFTLCKGCGVWWHTLSGWVRAQEFAKLVWCSLWCRLAWGSDSVACEVTCSLVLFCLWRYHCHPWQLLTAGVTPLWDRLGHTSSISSVWVL